MGKDPILEAGCGAGRVLKYFHYKGNQIFGIDYINCAVEKLKESDSSLNVSFGDITNLNFEDKNFGCIFAFGLYHGLGEDLSKGLSETHRVLVDDGYLCASFRADNIQNWITDLYNSMINLNKNKGKKKKFHKLNLTKSEFLKLLENHGFKPEKVYSVENMPFLYKFSIFRYKTHKKFNESLGRNEGYRLSFIGSLIQKIIMKFFSSQFCNVNVIIAKKIPLK